MKSSSSLSFVLILVVLVVVGALLYFFVVRDSGGSQDQESGLISATTGASQGLQNANTIPASASATGNRVVEILRNLSVIKLDDSVFQNPAFALLTDISIRLPLPNTQGRRNPFAPAGAVTTPTPTTTTPPTGPMNGL